VKLQAGDIGDIGEWYRSEFECIVFDLISPEDIRPEPEGLNNWLFRNTRARSKCRFIITINTVNSKNTDRILHCGAYYRESERGELNSQEWNLIWAQSDSPIVLVRQATELHMCQHIMKCVRDEQAKAVLVSQSLMMLQGSSLCIFASHPPA
jgi:hypothetical protein